VLDPIIAFDWPRMLWGDAPPLFLAEILFRVLVIWLWTALLLRWIGGRSIAQLSLVEFLLVIALGSAVGDALFYPEVPLLHAMLAILLIVLLDKAVDLAIRRWQVAKRLIDGRPLEVIRDGRILCDGVTARALGVSELMEMLRLKGIENLGEVRAAYLEPSGELSLFRARPARPGLRISPPVELVDPVAPLPYDRACCCNCGFVAERVAPECAACGASSWTMPLDTAEAAAQAPNDQAASELRSRRKSDMSGAAS
jgi:uncharacterized membrane protein YcaP (DUF421 family)